MVWRVAPIGHANLWPSSWPLGHSARWYSLEQLGLVPGTSYAVVLFLLTFTGVIGHAKYTMEPCLVAVRLFLPLQSMVGRSVAPLRHLRSQRWMMPSLTRLWIFSWRTGFLGVLLNCQL